MSALAATSAPSALCPPCRRLRDRWATSPMSPAPVRIISIGIYKTRDVMWLHRRRADDHYALVNQQIEGVYAACAAGHHAQQAPASGGQVAGGCPDCNPGCIDGGGDPKCTTCGGSGTQ